MSNNELATAVLDDMVRRENVLYENDAFKSAIYMDPRINYKNSKIITNEFRSEAIVSTFVMIFLFTV
jgi:hypothetical protein